MVLIGVVTAIAVMLVCSVLAMYTAEAKSGTKIKVTFGDVRSYNGKGTLKILNEDTQKIVFKKTIDFGKFNKKDDCCTVKYSFSPKNTGFGDELRPSLTTPNCGYWEGAAEPFKKGRTIKFFIDADEICE